MRRSIVRAAVLAERLSPPALWRRALDAMRGDTAVVAGTMAVQSVLRLASTTVLSRLLKVEAFGVIGIITSVIVTFTLLSDIGTVAFVVRHEQGEEPRFLDEVWTLRLIRSILLCAGMAVLARPIAHYLDKPGLAPAIAVGGLAFLIEGLDSMALFTSLRARRVKRIGAVEVASQIVGLLLSIGLAILLRSYWALIASGLLGQGFRAWLSYAAFPGSHRRWRLHRGRTREMWRFSRFIATSTVLTLVIGQVDKIVLARVLPLATLALYTIAASLAATPVAMVYAYASRILYPRYAQTARDARATLRSASYADRLTVSLLYALAIGALIALAPSVIAILYDPRYAGAAWFVRVLSISSFFALGCAAANDAMIAIGRPGFTLQSNVVRLGHLAVFAWPAYHWYGPTGFVWAVGTVEVTAQVFAWARLRQIGLLHWRYEIAFLAAGSAGLAIGSVLDAALVPLVRR